MTKKDYIYNGVYLTILVAFYFFNVYVFNYTFKEETMDTKRSQEKITVDLVGTCFDLERPSTSQEARTYEVQADVVLYLKDRKIESKNIVNLLEGNYAFNPPNYLLPEILLDPIDLSIFETKKWTVPSVHLYEEPINSEIKGECKLRVCADWRCYISEIPISEESYE